MIVKGAFALIPLFLLHAFSQICTYWVHMLVIVPHFFIPLIVKVVVKVMISEVSLLIRFSFILTFILANGFFLQRAKCRYLSLNINAARWLLQHHVSFVNVVLDMLNWTLLDVSDTECACLVGIFSCCWILIFTLILLLLIIFTLLTFAFFLMIHRLLFLFLRMRINTQVFLT